MRRFPGVDYYGNRRHSFRGVQLDDDLSNRIAISKELWLLNTIKKKRIISGTSTKDVRPKLISKQKIYKKKMPRILATPRNYRRWRRQKGRMLNRRINRLETGQKGQEWVPHDVTVNATVTNTGLISLLTGIPQGDDIGDRTGNKLRIQSIEAKGFILSNTAATADVQHLRIIIFRDLEQHGTVPAITELLEGGTYSSLREKLNMQRFQVIYDEWIPMMNTGTAASPITNAKIFKFYKKTKGTKVNYIGTSAAQASQGKGNYYLALDGNQATNGPTFTVNFRVRFTDA